MIIARMFLENCLLAIYLDRIFGMVNSREQQLASIFLIEVSMHALLQYLGKDVLISVLELFDFAHISLMTLKSFNKDHSDGWIRLLNSFLILNFLDKFKTICCNKCLLVGDAFPHHFKFTKYIRFCSSDVAFHCTDNNFKIYYCYGISNILSVIHCFFSLSLEISKYLQIDST